MSLYGMLSMNVDFIGFLLNFFFSISNPFLPCLSFPSGVGVRTHNTGVVSSKITRVTKTQSVRKATGSQLIKSISVEKSQGSVSGFCYA